MRDKDYRKLLEGRFPTVRERAIDHIVEMALAKTIETIQNKWYSKFNTTYFTASVSRSKSGHSLFFCVLEWLQTFMEDLDANCFIAKDDEILFVPEEGVRIQTKLPGHLNVDLIIDIDRFEVATEGGLMLEHGIEFHVLTEHKNKLKEFLKVKFENDTGISKLYSFGNYSHWESNRLPKRAWQSVILPKDQKKRIETDLEKFLSDRIAYEKYGIPWHRGYLFSGPPGTGKTSIALALANHFDLSLYTLNVGTVRGDNSLTAAIIDIPERAILLLEDVDIATVSRRKDETTPQLTPSLGGLLNMLDGVQTPPGLIKILTTNHPEKLDPALVRDGRVALRETIGYVTQEQIEGFCELFLGDSSWIPELPEGRQLAAASIMGFFQSKLETLDESVLDELALLLERDNIEKEIRHQPSTGVVGRHVAGRIAQGPSLSQ